MPEKGKQPKAAEKAAPKAKAKAAGGTVRVYFNRGTVATVGGEKVPVSAGRTLEMASAEFEELVARCAPGTAVPLEDKE